MDRRTGREKPPNLEPRWPAVVALLAVAGIYTALPSFLSIGPRWVLLTAVCLLLVPAVAFHRAGRDRLSHALGIVVTGVVTVGMVLSLGLLVKALPAHQEPPLVLLRSAAALWVTNVLVFALWYWRLDAGGPHQREQRGSHTNGAFLFPQMAARDSTRTQPQRWSPNFLDYLFLAFNTSTALSPTDTLVLSRWAKMLMMLQSIISLAVVVLLAARAVNIL